MRTRGWEMLDFVKESWHEDGYKCMRAQVDTFLYFDVWQLGKGSRTTWHVAVNEATIALVSDMQAGMDLVERLCSVLRGEGSITLEAMAALHEEIAKEVVRTRDGEDANYNAAFESGMKTLGERVVKKWGAARGMLES
jgi:hypothetical protein